MRNRPAAVHGLDEEDALMGACTCNSSWHLARNVVWPVAGRWHDLIGVVCPACGARREFVFDVTAFFEPRPGVWGERLSASGTIAA
jgi:hypothetical protein